MTQDEALHYLKWQTPEKKEEMAATLMQVDSQKDF